jgi:hypothetical protein
MFILLLTANPAGAQGPSPTTTLPPDLPPPGLQNPWIGALAIGTILVAGAAGLWIYRVIRKGL